MLQAVRLGQAELLSTTSRTGAGMTAHDPVRAGERRPRLDHGAVGESDAFSTRAATAGPSRRELPRPREPLHHLAGEGGVEAQFLGVAKQAGWMPRLSARSCRRTR